MFDFNKLMECFGDCVYVQNVNGYSKHPKNQNGESWKQHWLNSQKVWPSECCCCNKSEETVGELVGAHVCTERNRKQYIVPLCKRCNKLTGKFPVRRDMLVPVADE